jgi:prephenate dehydratase
MTNTATNQATDESSTGAAKPLRVSIQGYAGAFHEIAARYCFQEQPLEIIPSHTFSDLVTRVEKQEETDIGLMAIENTLAGSLMYNYQLLNESSLSITGEVYLRIKHNLMALPGQRIEDLREVHSHPMAIAQCRAFFASYPDIHLVETADTALSAREIHEGAVEGVGAIASTLAAELYELDVLAASIETNKKNHTRFLVLAPQAVDETMKATKVSLAFSVDHQVGSLYKILAILAAYNVNLTKIQSMPIIGKPWEYHFFVDFVTEGKMSYQQALSAIRPVTHNLKVLGVYDKGNHFEY